MMPSFIERVVQEGAEVLAPLGQEEFVNAKRAVVEVQAEVVCDIDYCV
jgi:hypothetical protein